MPDVSVSLVNTNSRELLLACLESLQDSDVEIVVLDNASEDGSAAAVRERFPAVKTLNVVRVASQERFKEFWRIKPPVSNVVERRLL